MRLTSSADQGYAWSRRPAWKVIVSSVTFSMGAFMALEMWRNWSGFGQVMHLLGPAFAAFMLVASVEYLQRVYLFYPDEVRLRILWLWRRIKLPRLIFVRATPKKEVLLFDADTGERSFRIPTDFTRSGRLAAELEVYYRTWQRVAEAGGA